MTVSAFYQRGYGWYDLYDDETNKLGLRRYGLDGKLFGSMLTLSWTHGPWTANYGLHVNEFRRDHTRDLVGGPRDYSNYGTKGEANAFAKLSYDSGRWHYYGAAQVRRTDFHYHGDVSIAPITWTFFNPKVGARYDLQHQSSLYVSAGLSTREPTRNDLFQGEDNATIAHDLHAVHPERLLDLEAGWNYHTTAVTLTANVYAMEFRHEIASTGELSDIGLLLRRNVDRSYRRGIELDGSWQAAGNLQPGHRLHAIVASKSRRRWPLRGEVVPRQHEQLRLRGAVVLPTGRQCFVVFVALAPPVGRGQQPAEQQAGLPERLRLHLPGAGRQHSGDVQLFPAGHAQRGGDDGCEVVRRH